MPTIERAGNRIHYDVLGRPEAPPLLLIMGLALSSRGFASLPSRLAEHFRVITFDNRGTGRSRAAPGFFRIQDLADDAAAVLDAVVDSAAAHVFGVSMGGVIAQELTLRHPTRVRSLVLGCTYACWRRSEKAGLGAVARLVRSLFVRPAEGIAMSAPILVSDAYYAANAAALTEWIRNAERAPPRTGTRQLLAIMRHSAESRLDAIDVPTLVLTGDSDRLVPPSNSRHLAKRIKGARLVELAGAGHCFPLEREDDTVSTLVEFYSSSAGSDR
jgi:pimeloyl-ACP methyl ester carboxylesterase